MAIISFSPDTIIDYVPEYGDNRSSAEPCIVRMRFVPYKTVQENGRLAAARMKGSDDPARQAEAWLSVQRKQFIDSIESVSGFFVDGKEVTAAAEFYDHAPSALVHELVRAMEDSAKLTEGQRKN